jgi:acetyl esterase
MNTPIDPNSPSELDDQTRQMIEMIEADPFLDPVNMTPAQMRKAFDEFYLRLGYPTLPVLSVTDVSADGPNGEIRAKVYMPFSAYDQPLPMVVFLHGGGMMMGSIEAYDGLCRRLASASGCIIASSSYSLSPEKKFPCALQDADFIVRWFHDRAAQFGADQSNFAIAGESGGGNLAAAITHRFRNAGIDIVKYQVLINPAVGVSGKTPSMEAYAKGYFFEPESLDWMYAQYLPDMSMIKNPEVSPLFSPSFEDLPPAFIVIAGCDILRSDIETYCDKLVAAGVPTATSLYDNTIHGFTCMAQKIDKGAEAIDECGKRLKDFFAN